MTAQQAQERVENIRRMRGDAEIAHAAEDRLHQDVLTWVAASAPEPFASVAKEALVSRAIDFPRHCA